MRTATALLYALADAIPQRPQLMQRAIIAHAADYQRTAIQWSAQAFEHAQRGEETDAEQAVQVAAAYRRDAQALRDAARR